MDDEKSIENKIQKQDLSQKTIIVLVILTVLISVLGTIAVLNEVNTIHTISQPQQAGSSSAKVQLQIVKPGDSLNAPEPISTTGRVSLTILPQK